MNKRLFFKTVTLLLVLVGSASSHEQLMHQHITREAFELLQKSFPGQLAEMSSYIGIGKMRNGGGSDGSFNQLAYEVPSSYGILVRIDCKVLNRGIKGSQFDGYLRDSTQSRGLHKVGVGATSNFLFSSNILESGFSGFGVIVEPYLLDWLAFEFKLSYWTISSVDPDYFDTPFNTISVLRMFYLVKFEIEVKNQLFFTRFGILTTAGKVGAEKRGGFSFGIGYRLCRYRRFSLYAVVDRSILGQFGAHGNIWDRNSEFSLEVLCGTK